MRVFLECYPCFLRQALDCAKISSADPKIHKKALDAVMKKLLSFDYDSTPPRIARGVYDDLKRITGNPDPYCKVRKEDNLKMLSLYEKLKERVDRDEESLRAALRLAAAGNIIDSGAGKREEYRLNGGFEYILREAPAEEEIGEIMDRLKNSSSLLYLGDNSGEILLDRILIEKIREEYPSLEVIYAVRGAPVINDAILEDAAAVGMYKACSVIDNGDSSPGTDIEHCSEEFREVYEKAGMIISKGQGNYETLSGSMDPRIFYLLVAKCPVIARDLNTSQGTLIARRAIN